jgi:hypothetical protein
MRWIAGATQLKRMYLLERLQLELDLIRGLRLLALCLVLFALVCYAAVLESVSDARLGLMNTYKTVFNLDDGLADIKTADDLQSYLQLLSARSRLLQPLSSVYFGDAEGEIKIFANTRSFDAALNLNARGLNPRVDSAEWTITAWVQLDIEGGTNIIRKPLGVSLPAKDLSCWAWYIGWPYDRFDYGAVRPPLAPSDLLP